MNLPKLEKLMQTFYDISSMDIAIVDSKNRIITRRYPGNKFCAQIHKCADCAKKCTESDSLHMKQAYNDRTTVAYTCPYGIFEAISPIFENGHIIAYLFLGMAVKDDPSQRELVLKSLLSETNISAEEAEKLVNEIPAYSEEKLYALTDMLHIMSEYIENNRLISDTAGSIGLLAKRYIKNNLSEKITLSDIAWHLHCSTVTLTEHFKREFGITVMEYVLQKRMQNAQKMLSSKNISIREVSESCGFSSIEYFSKSFRAYFGMSPREWRDSQ